MTYADRVVANLAEFAASNNPCCAGCDWWEPHNTRAGECTRTAPVAGLDRVSLLGIRWTSAPIPAGHIVTPREYRCGEFKAI